MGGGTEREVKGEHCQGGGGRVGGGMVKGQLSLRPVAAFFLLITNASGLHPGLPAIHNINNSSNSNSNNTYFT